MENTSLCQSSLVWRLASTLVSLPRLLHRRSQILRFYELRATSRWNSSVSIVTSHHLMVHLPPEHEEHVKYLLPSPSPFFSYSISITRRPCSFQRTICPCVRLLGHLGRRGSARLKNNWRRGGASAFPCVPSYSLRLTGGDGHSTIFTSLSWLLPPISHVCRRVKTDPTQYLGFRSKQPAFVVCTCSGFPPSRTHHGPSSFQPPASRVCLWQWQRRVGPSLPYRKSYPQSGRSPNHGSTLGW